MSPPQFYYYWNIYKLRAKCRFTWFTRSLSYSRRRSIYKEHLYIFLMRIRGVVAVFVFVALASIVSAVWSVSLPSLLTPSITGHVIFPVDTVPMYGASNGLSYVVTNAARYIIFAIFTTDPAEAISISASTVCPGSFNSFAPCPPVGDPAFYLMRNPEGDKTVPLYQLRINSDVIAGQMQGFENVRKPITYFYTTNDEEKNAAIQQGWSLKGTVGYLYKTRQTGTVPIYRSSSVANFNPPKDVYYLGTSGSGTPLGYGYDKTYGNAPVVPTTSPTCSFTYSDWSLCSSAGEQSRSVLSSSPENCVGGTPLTSQQCIPACTDADWTIKTVSENCVVDYTKYDMIERRYMYERLNGCQGGVQHSPHVYHVKCSNLPSNAPEGAIAEVTMTSAKGWVRYPSSESVRAYENNGTHSQNIRLTVSSLDPEDTAWASISSLSFNSDGTFSFPLPSFVVPGKSYKIDLDSRMYSRESTFSRPFNPVFLAYREFEVAQDGSIRAISKPFPANPSTSPSAQTSTPPITSTPTTVSTSTPNTPSTIPTTVIASNTPTPICTEADWQSTISPSTCPSSSIQTKTWSQIGRCEGGVTHPSQENINCMYSGGGSSTTSTVTCSDFTYSDWNACSNGIQTRSITSSSPEGCINGNSMTIQSCTSGNGGSCESNGQCNSGLTCSSNVCQVASEPSADHAPHGGTSPTEGNMLRGWSGDIDCMNSGCTVELHFYMDYPAGNLQAFIGNTIADKQFAGTEKNNYVFALPSGYPNGQSHIVYVYALGKDAQGNNNGNNILLGTTNIAAIPSSSSSSSSTSSVSCSDFTYSDWSACSQSGTQSREVSSSGPTGCTGGNPATSQQCVYIPECTEADWQATTSPLACPSSGEQLLSWVKVGQCVNGVTKQSSTISCTPNVISCSDFTYSDWSACSQSGTQVRSVIDSSPDGCQDGVPILVQSCQYTPLCTEVDWSSTLFPEECPQTGSQARVWSKIGLCEGGVSHSPNEAVSCTPPAPPAITSYSCLGDATPGSVPCGGQQDGLSSNTNKVLTLGNCDGVTKCQYSCGGKSYIDGACTDAPSTTTTAPPSTTDPATTTTAPPSTTDPDSNDAGVLVDFTLGLLRGLKSSIVGFVIGNEGTVSSTCTQFTYTDWTVCSQSGTQSRTLLTSGPSSCTGGNPVLNQQCQYIPPCTDADWQAEIQPVQCPNTANGAALQTVVFKKIGSCTGGVGNHQNLSFVCNPQIQITPANLNLSGIILASNANRSVTSPALFNTNTFGSITCTGFTYSNWSACSQSGTQNRYVAAASPANCFGGNPILSQTCTDNPNLGRGSTGAGNACVDLASCKYSPTSCPKWGKQVRTCYNTCAKMEIAEEITCVPGAKTQKQSSDNSESVGFGKKFVCKIANLFNKNKYQACLA
jgi:hypothetical protein